MNTELLDNLRRAADEAIKIKEELDNRRQELGEQLDRVGGCLNDCEIESCGRGGYWLGWSEDADRNMTMEIERRQHVDLA